MTTLLEVADWIQHTFPNGTPIARIAQAIRERARFPPPPATSELIQAGGESLDSFLRTRRNIHGPGKFSLHDPEEPSPPGQAEGAPHASWCRALCKSHRDGIRCGLHENHACSCRCLWCGLEIDPMFGVCRDANCKASASTAAEGPERVWLRPGWPEYIRSDLARSELEAAKHITLDIAPDETGKERFEDALFTSGMTAAQIHLQVTKLVAELRAKLEALRVRVSDVADHLCGLQVPGLTSDELLTAIERHEFELRQQLELAERLRDEAQDVIEALRCDLDESRYHKGSPTAKAYFGTSGPALADYDRRLDAAPDTDDGTKRT